MKYIDEYRSDGKVEEFSDKIRKIVQRPWTIMEICGGQTHAILRFGIDQLLPERINLVHGPGCPVCVTPAETVDKALEVAGREGVIFCSFGDMLRVPGSLRDLLSVKADGGDIRTVYSPLDAVKLAADNPERPVVFFAVGFETTAPATAAAILMARQAKITNFFILSAHVLVIPAMETILSAPDNRVQGFLAAGHVSTVIGSGAYEKLVKKHGAPVVVTGFEPLDLMQGIYLCVKQLEEGRAEVENQYSRAVSPTGNLEALKMMSQVFETAERGWRGIGNIEQSGLRLRKEYGEFDAEAKFKPKPVDNAVAGECISGLILQGAKKPDECPFFASKCTPETPLGATMVSSEGACAAYYRYRKVSKE